MIYPMFSMVLLTFIVGLIAFFTRVKSVKSESVDPKAYKLMDADNYPEAVIKTTRNFNNQFEVPLIFYVGCLSYLVLNISSSLALGLAWFFVILRVIHSCIHITYNHLLHRIAVFWSSFFVVFVLWLVLIFEIT